MRGTNKYTNWRVSQDPRNRQVGEFHDYTGPPCRAPHIFRGVVKGRITQSSRTNLKLTVYSLLSGSQSAVPGPGISASWKDLEIQMFRSHPRLN